MKGSFKNFKKSFDSKIHTYYFHLDIGESQNSYYKISEYILPISNLKELALKLNLPAIKPSQCIFQITPILDNEKYHDQVFMNIRDFHITTESIKISINSVRSTNTGWGLHLMAHLTVTIYEKEILILTAKK